jgi:hypothetical protein
VFSGIIKLARELRQSTAKTQIYEKFQCWLSDHGTADFAAANYRTRSRSSAAEAAASAARPRFISPKRALTVAVVYPEEHKEAKEIERRVEVMTQMTPRSDFDCE